MDDGILLRKIDALEKVAGTNEIICGKTATITSANMSVKELFIDGLTIKNTGRGLLENHEVSEEAR